MTPSEIHLAIEGWQEGQKEQSQNAIVQAWYTALWCSFTKKLNPLNKILKDIWKPQPKEKAKARASDDELKELAKKLDLKGPW
jgi:hypothetical protein